MMVLTTVTTRRISMCFPHPSLDGPVVQLRVTPLGGVQLAGLTFLGRNM